MNLNQAIEHLSMRLQGTHLEVNNQDKKAFNCMLEYINTTLDESFKRNKNFANLYAYCLGFLMDMFQTTIDNPIPHKELHKIIDTSFENIIEDITNKMNNRLRCSLLKHAGGQLDKQQLVSFQKNGKVVENLIKLLSISNNRNAFLENVWSVEEVSRGIKVQLENFNP
ncbi:hypothetical protein HZY62_21550 [Maribacter polysiphoniae]|uniref:Uncharacterized protein n=1 Tax=Maribacter polysiphoniae TaxID=429344 RepID=A0A316DKM7_9FLAO|nr:hypothetical protein [Maribacter polysiphoniae]MBD1263187.1 hypothetical protein [Maribacter polysiphoniae]PWK18445.1 hypothetical protein LX92_04319 [Maribacter polysiphoniae]